MVENRRAHADAVRRGELASRLGGLFVHVLGKGKTTPAKSRLARFLGLQREQPVAQAIADLCDAGLLLRRRSQPPTVVTGSAFDDVRSEYAEPHAAEGERFAALLSDRRDPHPPAIEELVTTFKRAMASKSMGGGRWADAATLSERFGVSPGDAREAALRLYEEGWLDGTADGTARIDQIALTDFRFRSLIDQVGDEAEWLEPLAGRHHGWRQLVSHGFSHVVCTSHGADVLVAREWDGGETTWRNAVPAERASSRYVAAIRGGLVPAIRAAIAQWPTARWYPAPPIIVERHGRRIAVSISPDAIQLITVHEGGHLHVRIPTVGRPSVVSVKGEGDGVVDALTSAAELRRRDLVRAHASGLSRPVLEVVRQIVGIPAE